MKAYKDLKWHEKAKILKQAGMGDKVEAVEHGFCPLCGKPVSQTEVKDELSRKEYKISGMCSTCQDETFGGDE